MLNYYHILFFRKFVCIFIYLQKVDSYFQEFLICSLWTIFRAYHSVNSCFSDIFMSMFVYGKNEPWTWDTRFCLGVFFFLSAIITDCEFLPYCWEEKKFTVQQNILFRIRFPLLSVWDFNCLKQWTDVTVLLWSVKNAAWLVGVKIVICLGTFSTQVSLTCPTSRFLFKLTSLFPSVFEFIHFFY